MWSARSEFQAGHVHTPSRGSGSGYHVIGIGVVETADEYLLGAGRPVDACARRRRVGCPCKDWSAGGRWVWRSLLQLEWH